MKRILSVFVIACCLFFLATAVFSIFTNSHFVLAQEDEQEATQKIELHRRDLVNSERGMISNCTAAQMTNCLNMCYTNCTMGGSMVIAPLCLIYKCTMAGATTCNGMGNCISP